MSSSDQSLYSTPVFELFRRGLATPTVKKFRGINVYRAVTEVGPEHAQNCLNVMVGGWGGLSKFRLPIQTSVAGISGSGAGPVFFTDFQQANGTRQIVCNFANNSLWYLTNDGANQFLMDSGGTDAPIWSMVEANNILFMANGQRMQKWTGANFWLWGIVAPTVPPTYGLATACTVQRAGGTVTLTFDNAGGPGHVHAVILGVGDPVTINCPGDASYNGTFAIGAVTTQGTVYTYAQAGGNSGPFAATATVNSSSFNLVKMSSITRGNGVVTIQTQVQIFPSAIGGLPQQLVGDNITVAGAMDPTLNGTFPVATVVQGGLATSTTITILQPGLPDSAVELNTGTVSGGVSSTQGGGSYVFSYANSVTGHVSNYSPPLASLGNITNRIVYVNAVASTDPQVDTYYWFRTLDGGGDYFLSETSTLGNPLADANADAFLNTAIQGPLLNNPPPIGNFLAVGQSRVFVGNLVGATTDIIYSGYEQILLGRPEESFPPNNRLKLEIGASSISGIGVLHHGIVAFSNTDRMYTLRGQVEDISITSPIQFSAYLEEMPWKFGCRSHAAIQSTPYGLVWWASDNTVQMFNFGTGIQDLSANVYPLLRQATPGFEFKAQSAYFNWLERDWYALLYPANGSTTPNSMIFWALDKESMEIDAFPCNIPANSIGILTTSKLQKYLAIGINDALFNLPVSQDTTGGISPSPNTIIPNTAGNLAAFWQSGYFQQENPTRSKMFRRGLLVADNYGAGANAMTVTASIVDNLQFNVRTPYVIANIPVQNGGLIPVNWRGNRCSLQINFPSIDQSVNILELSMGGIATSDR